MNQWISEPIIESMNQWPNDLIYWIIESNESTIQWINEPMNPWINESLNHEPTNQLINEESVPKRMNEWMNWRMGGWMDGLMDEWAPFLCWATSATPSLWSQLLLLRAATSAPSCLPASFSVASAIHFFSSAAGTSRLATSSCNPASHKSSYGQEVCVSQPPAAIPLARSVAASLMLCGVQRCPCVLSQLVANLHSKSVVPNR